MRTTWIGVIPCITTLAGCLAPQSREAAPLTAYVCDGIRFAARAEGDGIRLYLPDREAHLQRRASASGARYGDATLAFWSRGEDAVLQTRAVTYSQCRANAAEAPWQEALIRGVEFRAAGHDPAWSVEIAPGGRMTVDGAGGRIVDAPSERGIDRGFGRITYRAGGAALVVETKGCIDRTTGWSFPMTATLSRNGQEYFGCARPLR
jgi:membrane-bound inhibitor of C-type lysozyme